MGWANCGEDSKGRPIGYAHNGTCDHSDCDNKIDRGLAYACGEMHGQNETDCEGYFCSGHLLYFFRGDDEEMSKQLCEPCGEAWEKEEDNE